MGLAADDDLRERILAEIDGGTGVDGREDEGDAGDLFRELRFQRKAIARAEQTAALGEDVGGDEAWPWDALVEVSRDYLIETGKDLDAAAILLEGFVRTDGLPGLVAGTTIMADLVETYWDAGLYPREDEEDGIEARFQPLSGLSGGGSDKDGTLIAPLRRMVVAGNSATGELRYQDRVVADGQLATAQGLSGDKRRDVTAEAEALLSAIEQTARGLSRVQLQSAVSQVQAAETAWRRGIGYISERTKPRFPAASKVTEELRAIRDWLTNLLKLLPEEAATIAPAAVVAGAVVPAMAAGGAATVAGAGMPFSIGGIANRQEALQAVAAAAAFFEQNEPLSPIGSALREVIRRAGLSFANLLAELIPDAGSRELYYWRSGIKPPDGGTGATPTLTPAAASAPTPAPAATPAAPTRSSDGW